jgi:hypothetical protein
MAVHCCIGSPCLICHPVPTYTLPQAPTFTPQGCICPPTSEKTCEAINCPRKNPFRSSLSGAVGGVGKP